MVTQARGGQTVVAALCCSAVSGAVFLFEKARHGRMIKDGCG